MLLAVAPKVYMDLTDMDCGYKRALMFFPDVCCDALERRCLTGLRVEEGPARPIIPHRLQVTIRGISFSTRCHLCI